MKSVHQSFIDLNTYNYRGDVFRLCYENKNEFHRKQGIEWDLEV